MTSKPGYQTLDNKHAVQYLTKKRQPDNEIWSANRILQGKYFSSKIMPKIR